MPIRITNGFRITKKVPTNDGVSTETAGTSAYQIKTDFPNSADGFYWIKNDNIDGGTPFQIFADMSTDGGGWTLILTNAVNSEWTFENAINRTESGPTINANYSIVSYADYIKRSPSGFQYMIEANQRGTYGGIWTANGNYSFVNTDNTQTDITLNTKFSNWDYGDEGVEQIMPWYSNSCGILTTSFDSGGNWWGTLISQCGFTPAPWMANAGMSDPGIIWYWVR